jgi:secondary thiamine-phosphate synthase enzyme
MVMESITIQVKTQKKQEMIDITSEIEHHIKSNRINSGYVVLFVPHTTAAVTINENTDPDVQSDMISGLQHAFPNRQEYNHYEKNSDAHIKSSVIGASEYLLIENGKLMVGTWQGIYFCEFDGPRNRKVFLKIIEA